MRGCCLRFWGAPVPTGAGELVMEGGFEGRGFSTLQAPSGRCQYSKYYKD